MFFIFVAHDRIPIGLEADGQGAAQNLALGLEGRFFYLLILSSQDVLQARPEF